MTEEKRLNEIIRVKKYPNNFVTMDKTFLEDTRLSYKAKGILAYLLSKPDNWKVIVGNLVNCSKDGERAVYAGLKELSQFGYYKKVPIRDEKGHFIRWESTVYESPYPFCGFPEMDNPQMENPFLENSDCNNNYINNINYTKNNSQSCLVSQKEEKIKTGQTGQTDGQAHLEAVLSLIRENIDYENLKLAHPDEMDLVDNFVSVILDALLSKSKTIHINGEEKPRELVKSNLMKLGYADMEFALMQFQEQGKRIKKKQQYLLTMLYHASMERAAHYTNCVQADWGSGQKSTLTSNGNTDKGNYPIT